MSFEGLKVSPSELKFRFELRKNIPVTLSLQNPTTDRVAFKVKTTSPKKYCVRPSSGIVEPGATKDIQIIMQPQREAPPSLADCKDKFLVQSVIMEGPETEVTAEMFDPALGTKIKQSKLRVILIGPAKPPSPVPEGVEEENLSPTRLAAKENGSEVSTTTRGLPPTGDTDLAKERTRLQEDLNRASKENQELKHKVSVLEQQGAGRGQLAAGFSMIHLLVAALVGLLIGSFLLPRLTA
jgi:MSP (Major sperm protein) domain